QHGDRHGGGGGAGPSPRGRALPGAARIQELPDRVRGARRRRRLRVEGALEEGRGPHQRPGLEPPGPPRRRLRGVAGRGDRGGGLERGRSGRPGEGAPGRRARPGQRPSRPVPRGSRRRGGGPARRPRGGAGLPGRLHAPALPRLPARVSRPRPQRAPVPPPRVSGPGRAAPGLGARRQGQRGHRARGGRRPRRGPHRGPGGGAGPGGGRPRRAGGTHPGGRAPDLPVRRARHAGRPGPPRGPAPAHRGQNMTGVTDLDELVEGCVDVVTRPSLQEKLRRGKALTVKVGFDPTAPDIHLGHTVLMRKMRQFQDLGHRGVYVIGDFTGMSGDPTGKSNTRPPLSRDEIVKNAETYKKQAFKVLDPEKTEVRFNSEWLGALRADEFVRLAATYNVARMLERRDFKERYKAGETISVHEFLYPLAQAYDSVALE